MLQRTVQALRSVARLLERQQRGLEPDQRRAQIAGDRRAHRAHLVHQRHRLQVDLRQVAGQLADDLHDLVGDGVAAAEHQVVGAPAQADDLRAARAEVGSDAADLAHLRLDLVELAQLGGGDHRLALRAQPERAAGATGRRRPRARSARPAPARRATRGPRPGSGAARPPARRRRRPRCRARRARWPRPDRWPSSACSAARRYQAHRARRLVAEAEVLGQRHRVARRPSAPATRPPAGGRARDPRRSASRTPPRAPARARRSARRRAAAASATGDARHQLARAQQIEPVAHARARASPPSRNVTPAREKRSPKTLARAQHAARVGILGVEARLHHADAPNRAATRCGRRPRRGSAPPGRTRCRRRAR